MKAKNLVQTMKVDSALSAPRVVPNLKMTNGTRPRSSPAVRARVGLLLFVLCCGTQCAWGQGTPFVFSLTPPDGATNADPKTQLIAVLRDGTNATVVITNVAMFLDGVQVQPTVTKP